MSSRRRAIAASQIAVKYANDRIEPEIALFKRRRQRASESNSELGADFNRPPTPAFRAIGRSRPEQ
jgi:hypothetical protein